MKSGTGSMMKRPMNNRDLNFMAHFSELNKRVVLSFVSLGIALIPSWFLHDYFVNILLHPLQQIGFGQESLVVHQITEPLQVKMLVVLFLSFYISLPIFVYNIAAFLIPAAGKKFKVASWFLTIVSLIFFYGGAYLGYKNIYLGLDFLISFTDLTIGIRSHYYFQFIFRFFLFIGIFFQFPVIITILILNKIIKIKYLRSKRREIFLIILIASAIITPTGDPLSLAIFTLPVYVIYELLLLILKNKFD